MVATGVSWGPGATGFSSRASQAGAATVSAGFRDSTVSAQGCSTGCCLTSRAGDLVPTFTGEATSSARRSATGRW